MSLAIIRGSIGPDSRQLSDLRMLPAAGVWAKCGRLGREPYSKCFKLFDVEHTPPLVPCNTPA